MYVIIPNGTIKKGDPFPMIDIPTDVAGKDYTDFGLDDFQWWAYSKPLTIGSKPPVDHGKLQSLR